MQRVLLLLLSLLTTADAFAAITGAVFSDRGKPLAKAVIRAYRGEDSLARLARLASGAERKALATTTTNDDGTFSLDVAGVVELLASADGHGSQQELAMAGSPVVFSLVTAPARTVKVRAGGKPLAGARVYSAAGVAMHEIGVTNDAGELTVPDPSRWSQMLLIMHPGYTAKHIARHLYGALSFELTREKMISGRVVDANGKPVANALLLSGAWPAGRSKEDGTFTVPASESKVTAITANAQGSGTAEIRLEPRRSLTGTVVDVQGRAIAGLPVLAAMNSSSPRSDDDLGYGVAVSDEKGRFQFDGLREGEYSIYVQPVGDLEVEMKQADLRRAERVSIALNATARDLQRGTVIDARKKPVGGAIVSFLHPQAPLAYLSFGRELAVTRTGADGTFRIDSPHGAIRLAALHPDYALGASEPLDPDTKKRKPVIITIPDGVEVRGTVVGADDKPVAGAAIAVMQDPSGGMVQPLDAALRSGNATALFESGADGTFRLRLNERPHDILVLKDGYAPGRMVDFTPGKDPLRIVLARGVSIEGRVVKKDGGRVEHTMIFARGEDGSFATVAVETDGSFAVTSLTPGEYTLHVMSEDGPSTEKIVQAPAKNLVIELESAVAVSGIVVDKATGLPVSRYVVRGESSEVEVENGEPFTIEMSPGPGEIEVEAQGYVSARQDVIVDAARPAMIEIALRRARSIRGRVTGPNGTPLADVTAHLSGGMESTETAEDGEFVLEELPPETVTIAFTKKGFLGRRIEVAADRTEPLEVVLTKGRTITGRVVNESGQPVEGADVIATSAAHDSEAQATTSLADGTFRIEGLGEGRHSLRARKNGYRDNERNDVDLTANVPIVLTLRGTGATGTVVGKVTGFTGQSWGYGQVLVRALEDDQGWAQAGIGRDGRFRVENAPAGEVEVRASAASARQEVSTRRVTARVPAGGEVEVNLELRNDITVTGVVTSNGQPAPARCVSFYSPTGSWRAMTDANGRYEMMGIEPARYQVRVMLGERSFETYYEVTGSGTFDIAADFARLEGRVVDGEGTAIAGATVEANAINGGSYGEKSAVTDAAGAFVLERPAGEYEVSAAKKGYAFAVKRAQTGGAPIVLRLVQSEGLRVRLVDARDNTTLGGYVVARDTKGVQLGRVHDQEADGTMRLALAPGSYRISVSASGYATQTVHAAAPSSSELRIGLTPGGTLIVRTDRDATELIKLVLPGGEEYVRCECNGIAEIRLTGKMTRIEHVAAGTYELRVIGAGGKVLTATPVQVMEGGTSIAEVAW